MFRATGTTPAFPHRGKKRDAPSTTPAKKLRQTYLDFGQSKLGATSCRVCGLVYTPGLEDAEHIKYCKSKGSDVKWVASKDAEIVLDNGKDGMVILASNNDPRTKRLRELVDNALGFCEPENFSRVTKSFVLVLNSTAVGYLETDPINLASKVIDETKVQEVSFGVLKIWVHPEERRKHLASMLIDAARVHHGYPSAVPKDQFAFSPTTTIGRMLAENYCGTQNYLVYKM